MDPLPVEVLVPIGRGTLESLLLSTCNCPALSTDRLHLCWQIRIPEVIQDFRGPENETLGRWCESMGIAWNGAQSGFGEAHWSLDFLHYATLSRLVFKLSRLEGVG